MPENSPSRIKPDSHPTHRAFTAFRRELLIRRKTGIDPAKLYANPTDETAQALIAQHRSYLEELEPAEIAHLNDLRTASGWILNSHKPEEVTRFLELQGFGDNHKDKFARIHRPLRKNGSDDTGL